MLTPDELDRYEAVAKCGLQADADVVLELTAEIKMLWELIGDGLSLVDSGALVPREGVDRAWLAGWLVRAFQVTKGKRMT